MPTVRGADRGDRASVAWAALAWLVPAAVFANAAAYIAYAGNPLVSSDAWYFLDAFLHQALEGMPAFQDFFIKRGADDHAQPLLKALLWFNASWLGLDFVIEAMFGLAFAAAAFVLLAWSSRDALRQHPPLLRILLVGALAAVLVTLNCGMVFDWSLVTLGYLAYLLVLVVGLVAWRAIGSGRLAALFLAAWALAFLLDGVGTIGGLALAAASVLQGWRVGRAAAGVRAAAALLLGVVAARVLALAVFPAAGDAVAGATAWQGLAHLAGSRGEWLEMARIVFGSTFAHINQVAHHAPDAAAAWQGALAAIAVAAHAWFWWRAWKGPWNLPVFHAVTLMLLCYGMVAGILLTRVPVQGIAYLHEPRYAAIYLLANVALVLMLAGQPPARPVWRALAGTGAAALIALQVPLSLFTWDQGSYLYLYYHQMARDMYELGADPAQVPEDCVALVTICDMPEEARARTMGLLREHRLNIYSPVVAERYGLRPLLDHYGSGSEMPATRR